MKIAIVNIGQIVSGNWHEPFAAGADGMTAIPAGNNAKVYGLGSGLLAPGEAADLVLLDAPDGGNHAQGAGCLVS